MIFRSYTYDASEVDLQYYLDDEGKEIHEIVIDENAFTGRCLYPVLETFRFLLIIDFLGHLRPLFFVSQTLL